MSTPIRNPCEPILDAKMESHAPRTTPTISEADRGCRLTSLCVVWSHFSTGTSLYGDFIIQSLARDPTVSREDPSPTRRCLADRRSAHPAQSHQHNCDEGHKLPQEPLGIVRLAPL